MFNRFITESDINNRMGHLLSDAIHYLLHQYICMNYDIIFFMIPVGLFIWFLLKKVYGNDCQDGRQQCVVCQRFLPAKGGNACG